MKRFWIAILAVALSATAAQAGTVYKYEFDGVISKVNSGGSVISVLDDIEDCWFGFDTDDLPGDLHPTDDTKALYVSPPGQHFIDWGITVAGEDYEPVDPPTNGIFVDTMFIVNGASGASDSISISSIRKADGYEFTMYLEDSTGTAIGSPVTRDSNNVPTFSPPSSIDWSKWDTRTLTYILPSQGSNPALDFTASVVPVPAAAWLGLGMLGVLGVIRRIRRRR